MSIYRAALIGAACLLHAMAAGATTPSLRDAVRSLWNTNPEVQAARADLEAAHAQSSIVKHRTVFFFIYSFPMALH